MAAQCSRSPRALERSWVLQDTNDSKRARCAAHVERAVAEEVSEEWVGPGEYHLSEPVNSVGEGHSGYWLPIYF